MMQLVNAMHTLVATNSVLEGAIDWGYGWGEIDISGDISDNLRASTR